ncbi:hypothetical protein V8G54_006782 [Vigna mungo]|uniref:Uncharacterized protein n=1 Tax=Vigna mungo TaxID=3915 RepID=A0AAQ3P0M6_VIGMU
MNPALWWQTQLNPAKHGGIVANTATSLPECGTNAQLNSVEIYAYWLEMETMAILHWNLVSVIEPGEFGKTYLIKDQRKRCSRNMVVGKSIMLALHVLLCGKMSRGEMHAEGDSSDQRYLAGTEDARKKLGLDKGTRSYSSLLNCAWVLDATPGKVRAGGDGEDHPAELISFLSTLPKEEVVRALIQQGFSNDVAQWVVTNLRPSSSCGSQSSSFAWVFDLRGIAEMYQSYEETNLWYILLSMAIKFNYELNLSIRKIVEPIMLCASVHRKIVEDVPRGVHMNFLKAERSLHRWALEDLRRIHAAEELAAEEGGGVEMHVLEDAGHWVHADNPDGLFKILSSSFQGGKT